jgi:hypothetical protein
MRNWLIALSLALCACVSAPVDLVKTDGAIGRQIDRVLTRHDLYVQTDPAAPAGALAESDAVRSLAMLGEVRRASLGAAFAPVADRHDGYVRADPTLDELELETYLASTSQLRRLLLVDQRR